MEVEITNMGFNEQGDMCMFVIYKKPVGANEVKKDDFVKVVKHAHLGSAVLYQ